MAHIGHVSPLASTEMRASTPPCNTHKLPSRDIGGMGTCVLWHGQGCGEATRRASIATATHPVQHAVLARSTWGKTGESRWGREVCAFGSQWHERRGNDAVIT